MIRAVPNLTALGYFFENCTENGVSFYGETRITECSASGSHQHVAPSSYIQPIQWHNAIYTLSSPFGVLFLPHYQRLIRGEDEGEGGLCINSLSMLPLVELSRGGPLDRSKHRAPESEPITFFNRRLGGSENEIFVLKALYVRDRRSEIAAIWLKVGGHV